MPESSDAMTRRVGTARLAAAILAVILYPSLAGDIRAEPFSVVDGDTLLVDGKIRNLVGVRAPRLGERCRVRGRQRDCGLIARASLLDMTAGATVVCKRVSAAPAARYRCLADGYDLSEGIVHTGWARALPDAPARYRDIMREAQARKRGMWRKDQP